MLRRAAVPLSAFSAVLLARLANRRPSHLFGDLPTERTASLSGLPLTHNFAQLFSSTSRVVGYCSALGFGPTLSWRQCLCPWLSPVFSLCGQFVVFVVIRLNLLDLSIRLSVSCIWDSVKSEFSVDATLWINLLPFPSRLHHPLVQFLYREIFVSDGQALHLTRRCLGNFSVYFGVVFSGWVPDSVSSIVWLYLWICFFSASHHGHESISDVGGRQSSLGGFTW